jgi:integrase/recombinase XerD
MNYSVIHLNKMIHQNTEVVKLEFSYNEELVKLVKRIPGARWDGRYRLWYVEKRAGLLEEVLNCFKGKAYLDYKSLKNDTIVNAHAEPKKLPEVYLESEKPALKRRPMRVKQYALCI